MLKKQGVRTMPSRKKRVDITSADKQQLGFEFQYLYFMLRLLTMEPGEEVGYEALDDVHTVSSNGITTFIQVKHTLDSTANGDLTPLPKLSIDLWKSLSNWAKLIEDPKENRLSKTSQQTFINESEFMLIVNRQIQKNPVLLIIKDACNKKLNGTQIKKALKEISASTNDKTIKDYITDVDRLSAGILLKFFQKIRMESVNSLEDDIRLQIKAKMIPDSYVDDVFNSLYSQLKRDFFVNVKNRKHQVLSFEDWTKKYSAVFQEYRTTLLPLRKFEPTLPEHLEDQFFVKELIEIGAIDLKEDGLAEIAQFTHFYLSVQLQLDSWYEAGSITLDRRDQFHKDAWLIWKRIHQQSHIQTRRDISLDEDNAIACFYTVMREKLRILSTELGPDLSNGEFIKLANEKKIGWKYSWGKG